MKTLLLALAFALALPARGEERPDWFEPFRGVETFLVEDTAWLLRDPALAPDAPPVARLRHLVLLMKTENVPAFWWERRNVLLVEMASGSRYAAETAFKLPRQGREEDPVPWLRIASPGGAVEFSSENHGDPPRDADDEPDPGVEPCYGTYLTARGEGRPFRYLLGEASRQTARAGVADVRDAAFRESEREELWNLRRFPIERVRPAPDVGLAAFGAQGEDVGSARLAWMLLFLDRKKDQSETRFRVVPDSAPPAGDLASWSALTYIPLRMTRMEPPSDPESSR